MGKAKLRKKIDGQKKQIIKHIEKFKEAEERGALESMDYMAKELSNFLERKKQLEKRKKK
jgi:hypothetical protein